MGKADIGRIIRIPGLETGRKKKGGDPLSREKWKRGGAHTSEDPGQGT